MSAEFEQNRRAWDRESDAYQARHGEQLAAEPRAWGVWSLPEREIGLLGEVAGRDVLEYGCGGAQWSVALAQCGARVTGLDNSERQLGYARTAVERAGVAVKLVHAPGEATPFAADSFDLVFCDHGAMSFAAPERTIPEVARIMRPGGVFAFNLEHPLHAIACDGEGKPDRTLHASYFSLDRFADPEGTISFSRPVSTYVRLLDDHGFALERLLEPQPPATASSSYDVPLDWARAFPAELMIRARRR